VRRDPPLLSAPAGTLSGVGRVAPSRRRLAAVASLLLASAFGVALVAFRYVWSGQAGYGNLVWNLVLAWVPFVLALVVYDRVRRGSRGLGLLVPAALWLAFLPNAPYLVTDFVLLREIDGMPVWFDVALLTTFAWTGLLLGFASVYLVQGAVTRLYGSSAGWLAALGALGLSGLGVYLGRYLRLNSWDLLVQPGSVAGEVLDRLSSPRMVGMSIVMAAFLTVAYAMLYTAFTAAAEDRD
jgi:uncharacterized membrane protein